MSVTSIGWRDPRTKPGELLWPERFGPAEVATLKTEMGSRAAAGQLQQRPAPREGGMFKRHWWQRYAVLPQLTRAEIMVDSAFKDGVENDFSVFAAWGLDEAENAYLIRLWREKVQFPDLIQLGHTAAAWMKTSIPKLRVPLVVEDKASGQSAIQTWKHPHRTRTETLPALSVIPFTPQGTKVTRADGMSPLVEAGRYFIPYAGPHIDEWIEEHAKFPDSEHDDFVDTTSMSAARLFQAKRKTIRGYN